MDLPFESNRFILYPFESIAVFFSLERKSSTTVVPKVASQGAHSAP